MPYLKLPEADLYYETAGRGTPVLLIQGVGAAGEAWRPQVEGLKARHATALFDNRGVSKSVPCRGPVTIEAMAGDARALMDQLGWESAHVIGHSMGGIIAQQLALDCPRRVRSLSLLCTFARGKDAARLTPWVLWMTLRTRLGTEHMRRKAFLEMLYPRDFLAASDLDELAEKTGRLVGRDLATSPPILMKQVRAMARHDASGRLDELARIPTLVLSADQDPIACPRYGRELAKLIPGARFELMAQASHAAPIQHADAVNGILADFLERAEAGRAGDK